MKNLTLHYILTAVVAAFIVLFAANRFGKGQPMLVMSLIGGAAIIGTVFVAKQLGLKE